MAITAAIAAGALGAAAVGGGVGAAIKANRMKTAPKATIYGGSQDKKDALEETYLGGVQQGNAQATQGYSDLQKRQHDALKLGGMGVRAMQSAGEVRPVAVTNQGATILNQYHPGEVAAAQAKQALDANTAAAFGAARSGGALGLRNALNANATTGAQTAQGLAVQRAQEEQAYTQAQVAQANTNQMQQFQSDQQAAAQKAQLLGVGGQIAGIAGNQAIQSANMQTQAGLEGQQQYLGQNQNLNDQQTALNLAYEQARQGDKQRKSDRWFQLGGNLIGGGMNMIGKAVA
jgi:hypothetical protein